MIPILSTLFSVGFAQSMNIDPPIVTEDFQSEAPSSGPDFGCTSNDQSVPWELRAKMNWTDLRLEITSTSNRTVGAWHSWRGQEQEVIEMVQTRFPSAIQTILYSPGVTASSIMNEHGALVWHIEETRYHTSGGVEVDAYLDLREWLRPALREDALERNIPLLEGGHSGIVIDARHVDFGPVLSPTISLRSGEVITRSDRVLRDTLDERGAVLYVTDPADPRAIALTGERPLFAMARSGDRGTLVLEDGLLEFTEETRALAAHGLIVVVTRSIENSGI